MSDVIADCFFDIINWEYRWDAFEPPLQISDSIVGSIMFSDPLGEGFLSYRDPSF